MKLEKKIPLLDNIVKACVRVCSIWICIFADLSSLWLISLLCHLSLAIHFYPLDSFDVFSSVKSAFDVELDIVIAVCECLQLALPTPNLPITFMERVFSICKTHLASTNPTVNTSYSHLLNHMPCHVLSRYYSWLSITIIPRYFCIFSMQSLLCCSFVVHIHISVIYPTFDTSH